MEFVHFYSGQWIKSALLTRFEFFFFFTSDRNECLGFGRKWACGLRWASERGRPSFGCDPRGKQAVMERRNGSGFCTRTKPAVAQTHVVPFGVSRVFVPLRCDWLANKSCPEVGGLCNLVFALCLLLRRVPTADISSHSKPLKAFYVTVCAW